MKSFTTKLGAAPKGNLVGIIFGIILLVYILISTAEVWIANTSEKPYTYCQVNIWILATRKTKPCVVTECIYKGNDACYEVYVTDIKGNEYSYYDTDYMSKGTVLDVVFDGDKIVDIKD